MLLVEFVLLCGRVKSCPSLPAPEFLDVYLYVEAARYLIVSPNPVYHRRATDRHRPLEKSFFTPASTTTAQTPSNPTHVFFLYLRRPSCVRGTCVRCTKGFCTKYSSTRKSLKPSSPLSTSTGGSRGEGRESSLCGQRGLEGSRGQGSSFRANPFLNSAFEPSVLHLGGETDRREEMLRNSGRSRVSLQQNVYRKNSIFVGGWLWLMVYTAAYFS